MEASLATPRDVFRAFRRSDPDPAVLFDPSASDKVLEDPEIRRLLEEIPEGFLSDPRDALLFALRALAVQRSRLDRRLLDVDLVGTVPGGADIGTRATRMVVREMLRAAQEDVFVFGFEVSDAEFLDVLSEAARVLPVRILVDRERGSADRILSRWPESIDPPAVYTNRPGRGKFTYEKMHSKGILVDGRDLLITSANLTQHGMEGNFELGVRLRGAPAERTAEMMGRLLESELVERWQP